MTDYVEPEWALVTVMFVDIRGFTTFADRSTARDTAAYLNEFFETVVPLVLVHGGHVNQLLGDGLLALFGAPKTLPDHADRALLAGRDMLDAVTARMGDRCRIGIGLNSGLVLVGTMGGGGYAELGVVGDPVNVAARVESATKELGESLLLTEATRVLLESTDPTLTLIPRGSVPLKGKAEPVVVHGLAPRNAFRTPPA